VSKAGRPATTPKRGQLLLPMPHPGQVAVRQQGKRFNWLAAGRRWRKTTLVMSIAAEAALAGRRILWGAPTYDQVRVGWSEMRHGAALIADFNQTFMTATFPTGGTVTFRSLDNPDAARGHTADGIVMDESGDVHPDAWAEVLRPMLIDTGGWAWCVGSPRGLNWFWREWAAAQDNDESVAWQAPTLGVAITDAGLVRRPHPLENPTIEFPEVDRLYQQMAQRVFAQEILAEFVESGGGVFRNLDEACVLQPYVEPRPGHHYVIGVDWALSHDFTVISVFDAFTLEQVFLDRFNRIDYAWQLERLLTHVRRFRPIAIVPESNSIGTPLCQDLMRHGLPVYPFTTTSASKRAAVEALSLALEQRTVKLLADPVQKQELLAFQSQQLPSGQIRYAAPEGAHDDTVMATAMAWYAITHAEPLPQKVTIAAHSRGGGWSRSRRSMRW
jgi:hypothetical protein